MSDNSVNQYRIYCITEGCWVQGYGQSPPTTCYNNPADTVNPESVQVVQTIVPNTVVISEEEPGDPATGGHYKCAGFSFTAAAGTTTNCNNSFAYPISMLTCQLQVSADMVGDSLDFCVGGWITVGGLTTTLSTGSTSVTVSDAAIPALYVGLSVQITDGTNTNDCGLISNIVNNVITFVNPTTYAFTAGSVIQVTRYFVQNYYIGVTGIHQIGFSKIGGGYIPTGIVGTCAYTNRGSAARTVAFCIEHLY